MHQNIKICLSNLLPGSIQFVTELSSDVNHFVQATLFWRFSSFQFLNITDYLILH